jgi:hypothetical protein
MKGVVALPLFYFSHENAFIHAQYGGVEYPRAKENLPILMDKI